MEMKMEQYLTQRVGRTVADVLMKHYKIKRNKIRVAKILNEATAELITTIRGCSNLIMIYLDTLSIYLNYIKLLYSFNFDSMFIHSKESEI